MYGPKYLIDPQPLFLSVPSGAHDLEQLMYASRQLRILCHPLLRVDPLPFLVDGEHLANDQLHNVPCPQLFNHHAHELH